MERAPVDERVYQFCGEVPATKKTLNLEFLDAAFLEAMNDIGRYGHEKYGKDSFHHRALLGDRSRGELRARTSSHAIIKHSQDHGMAYLIGEKHDKFGTLKHQLAAAAFNPMMEFYFAGLEDE